METIRPLQDTQSQPDRRGIPIDRVGIRGLRWPMQVRDKARSVQHTVATVTLTVDLPHHFKGTHMSRFVEVLGAFGAELRVESVPTLLRELAQRLESKSAHATFDFPFFLEKRAPATRAPGLMDYMVRFDAELKSRRTDFVATVIVPVTTLCPCSKAIAERGAHNQRGQVTFSVRFRKPLWIEDLIALVEKSASSELYSVLKRPDEKAVTERAYDNPVFVEDLVRNVAARAKREPNIAWFRVEAENYESIHNHNALAVVESRGPKGGRI